jgi:hypothetical protein
MPELTKLAARLAALALLALLAPPAVAGPPEGVSGRMVLDEVVAGLMRYRCETDQAKRWDLLANLARTRDPRVAVVLGELLDHGNDCEQVEAACLIILHYQRREPPACLTGIVPPIRAWWKKNEADLRRRAKELPR